MITMRLAGREAEVAVEVKIAGEGTLIQEVEVVDIWATAYKKE